ncbi:restriction endonuclease subunit S [Vagococcus carniphilus]|uniref:restriction endonuclease subunit S n=1 Tax=Vagococcus carniphilus TaxID=218144 RepID=UPI0028923681|nr:restriction endonuclease subunit S [Vagococcus carniphilus]MDT2830694.1 restriction endonuclease subunit S [Vagococcus carniphilus]MDT2839534.1 restriction endonuclease subunit S [Vagococcus carniphilus]MDT2853857.1 restriction endonuclease subunit S [Vagococcus carniphilus]
MFDESFLGEISSVGDGAHSKVKRVESGVLYLTSKNIKKGFLELEKVDYISKEDYKRLFSKSTSSVRHLETDDILVGIIGTFGNIYQYSDKDCFGISSSIGIIRPNKEIINPKYLYYYLRSRYVERYIENIKGGSVQGYTNLNALRSIPVKYPQDIHTQGEIVNILKSIDTKIELNNQMIDTLEEIASTLFKRWFVDFEFPDENGNLYKSSGGKMIDSELGEIPEGWGISSIDEISKNIITGKTPSTKKVEFYGGNIPFITIPDMHNKIFIVESERYLTEEGKVENKILPPNSICVSCIATPGLVVFNSIESQTNQQINSIVPHELDKYWLFLNLKSKKQLIRDLGSGGSTTLNLNKTQFSRIQLVSPQNEVKEKFNVVAKPLFDLILGKLKENVTLVDSRDTLLPKLLSGELEV